MPSSGKLKNVLTTEKWSTKKIILENEQIKPWEISNNDVVGTVFISFKIYRLFIPNNIDDLQYSKFHTIILIPIGQFYRVMG